MRSDAESVIAELSSTARARSLTLRHATEVRHERRTQAFCAVATIVAESHSRGDQRPRAQASQDVLGHEQLPEVDKCLVAGAIAAAGRSDGIAGDHVKLIPQDRCTNELKDPPV